MSAARQYVRKVQSEPSLFIRPTTSDRDVEFQFQLAFCDGDNHLLGLQRDEIRVLASTGNVYQAEQSRPVGRTRDLLCASTVAVDRWVRDRLLTAISNSVVRRTKRGFGIGQLVAAVVMASRLVFDDRRSLAMVSVTAPDADDSRRALMRAGAVLLTADAANRLHPILGEFHATRQTVFKNRGFKGQGAEVWIFTRSAIRSQLALAYDASGPEGLPWELDDRPVTVRIEGELTDFGARDTLLKMITNVTDLPVDVADVGL